MRSLCVLLSALLLTVCSLFSVDAAINTALYPTQSLTLGIVMGNAAISTREQILSTLGMDDVSSQGILPSGYTLTPVFNSSTDASTAVRAAIWEMNTLPSLVGIIAVSSSSVAQPLSIVNGAYSVPTVSPTATSEQLSNKQVYPLFARTVPPDSQQAVAMLSLLTNQGWSKASIVYAIDPYSSGLASNLQSAAQVATKNLTASVRWSAVVGYDPSNLAQLRTALSVAMDAQTRIIVGLVNSDIWSFLKVAAELGMIGVYQFVFPDTGFSPSLVSSDAVAANVSLADALRLTQGIIGTRPASPVNNVSTSILDRCRSFTRYDLNGTAACATTDQYMNFAYDTSLLFGYAIRACMEDSWPLTGANIVSKMKTIPAFHGATGLVKLDTNGDRIGNYEFMNWNAGATSVYATYEPASAVPFTKLYQPFFADGTQNTPSQDPPNTYKYLSAGGKTAMLALMALFIALSVALMLFIFIHREHKVIKGSNVFLCELMLLGSVLSFMYAGIEVHGYDRSVTCILPYICICFGFDLIFGGLLTKTLMIHSIFNNRQMRVQKFSNFFLLRFPLLFVLVDAAIFLIWGLADQPTPVLKQVGSQAFTVYWSCHSSVVLLWQLLLMLPKFAMLAVAAVLAYKVRKVSSNFNESKWIGMAVYNFILVGVITIALVNYLDDIDASFIIGCIGVFVCGVTTNALMFGPKLVNMYITLAFQLSNKGNQSVIGSAIDSQDGIDLKGTTAGPTSDRLQSALSSPTRHPAAARTPQPQDSKRSLGSTGNASSARNSIANAVEGATKAPAAADSNAVRSDLTSPVSAVNTTALTSANSVAITVNVNESGLNDSPSTSSIQTGTLRTPAASPSSANMKEQSPLVQPPAGLTEQQQLAWALQQLTAVYEERAKTARAEQQENAAYECSSNEAFTVTFHSV